VEKGETQKVRNGIPSWRDDHRGGRSATMPVSTISFLSTLSNFLEDAQVQHKAFAREAGATPYFAFISRNFVQ
jgi:hypothetical protein